ncbi:MAG: DUF1624 domain-containing protein [Oscillospiraceae bacterium]|nr:DUF1624 domain-containing protein [Oscillospiraceae bacterium]
MEGSVYSPVRAHFLDEVRGLSILLVVLHHTAWDLHHLFGVRLALVEHPIMDFLQPAFAGVFVFVSGMVCNTSRSNLRRGWITLACGLAISAATKIALPAQTVRFGILHLLGACMLLYGWGSHWIRKLPAEVGFVLTAFLFAITRNVPDGSIGVAGWSAALPKGWYQLDLGFIVGLPDAGFRSADYFPLIPWVFLFFAGSFLGRPVFAQRSPAWLFDLHLPPLAWLGRHTLWVYLLHQPLLFGLMNLIFQ